MRLKSVSSLILMFGIFGYLAMQVGVRGPATAQATSDPSISVPQRTEQRPLPPRHERISSRPQIYFATVR
jgi:hypothetical protein